jgi:hypothetical protein
MDMMTERKPASRKYEDGPLSGSILITHPYVGSMWLDNAVVETAHDGKQYVSGRYFDDSDAGSSMMPDDYMGQDGWANFPVGCIRRVERHDQT